MPTKPANNTVNNAFSVPEIPKQITDPPAQHTITIEPEVNAFLIEHMKGRGDLNHCVNWIIKMYRDALPLDRRGGLVSTDSTPASQTGSAAKVSELKKASNGSPS
jgi:hypothetical protein